MAFDLDIDVPLLIGTIPLRSTFSDFAPNMADPSAPRLPDGDSQILRFYVFGPSGLKDYGSATLHCKI